jgi:hypothetical protein
VIRPFDEDPFVVYHDIDVDLTGFADRAVTLVASGWASPPVSGQPFTMFGVRPDGTTFPVPEL